MSEAGKYVIALNRIAASPSLRREREYAETVRAAADYIERMDKLLRNAPHANGTICAIYDIDWDIETDPPVDEPCNCWKREIDAPGGE